MSPQTKADLEGDDHELYVLAGYEVRKVCRGAHGGFESIESGSKDKKESMEKLHGRAQGRLWQGETSSSGNYPRGVPKGAEHETYRDATVRAVLNLQSIEFLLI
jgi:hypothetical protein